MNKINIFLQMSLMTVVVACSSTQEKTQKDDFFVPVDQIVRQKTGSSPVVLTRGSFAKRADDGLKDSLIQMLRQQNKRLDDVVQNLNLLMNKENDDKTGNADNLNNLMAARERTSNEMLLEVMRDQNQRLNEVIEQIKILFQNQTVRHSNLTARVDVSPIQKAPARQDPGSTHPATTLSYAKAIQWYQNHQYEKAVDAFEQLLSRRIKPKLADRYHFWLGVCYFNLNKGNQAIREFTQVLNFGNSDKAESAYFMMGQCYERIGLKKKAKLAFEKMLQIFPRGSLKRITEIKLALLK